MLPNQARFRRVASLLDQLCVAFVQRDRDSAPFCLLQSDQTVAHGRDSLGLVGMFHSGRDPPPVAASLVALVSRLAFALLCPPANCLLFPATQLYRCRGGGSCMSDRKSPFEETREVPVRLATQRLTASQLSAVTAAARQKSRHAGPRGRDVGSHRYRHIFLEEAGKQLNDDCFCLHLASETNPREFGALYYVCASAKTALESVLSLMRYIRVVSSAEAFNVVETAHQIVVEGQSAPGLEGFGRQMFEYGDAVLIAILRELTGVRISPQSLDFDHERFSSTEEFRKFFGCPVNFGAPVHRMIFSRKSLEVPLLTADSHLHNVVGAFFDEALQQREHVATPLRAKVETLVSQLLPQGKAGVENVAKAMSMSTRTFARRLASEGVTYASLLDELRRNLATRKLEDPNLELSELAWLLGYTEVSSFNHAFRRWTGTTPKAFRKKISEK